MVGHNLPPDCDWVNISENLGKAPCLPYLWLRLRNAYCPSIYTVKIGLIEMILLLYLLKILIQVWSTTLKQIITWVKHMVFHTMVFQLCNMNHGLFQIMERTPWNQRYTLYTIQGRRNWFLSGQTYKVWGLENNTNLNSIFCLIKSSKIDFIFLPAFYLNIWLMTWPKNFEKIAILKIWELVS